MRIVSLLLTGALATTFAVLLCTYALLDTAPKPWDEAFLLSLPTRLHQVAEEGDIGDLVATYYQTHIFKPPVSMIGTSLSMGMFGTDAIGQVVDNLLVALLAAFLAALFLARYIDRTLAAALAACMLVSPFALQFARVELAELYLWAGTLLYIGFLTRYHPLRSKGGMMLLGGIGGVGIATKLSFPLIAGPLALWHLVAELRHARGEGGVRPVLLRSLGAVLTCALVVAALCGKNWKHMWRHLRNQYGWVGEEFGGGQDRLDLDFLTRYALDWAGFVGWFWIGLAVLALAGVLIAGTRRRQPVNDAADKAAETAPELRAPVAALLFTMLVNLGYCYFFPVIDTRFTIGAIAAFTLLVGIGVGTATRGRPRLAAWFGVLLLLPNFVFLLSNSFVPSGHGAPVLDLETPGIGRLARVLPAPCRDADLRERVLSEAGVISSATANAPAADSGRLRIGLAGDHRSLNIDNLRLFALRRHLDLEFVQIGYLGKDLSVDQRREKAGSFDGWVVLVASDESTGPVWRRGGAALKALASDPALKRSPWTDRFADGTTVHVFRRRVALPGKGK